MNGRTVVLSSLFHSLLNVLAREFERRLTNKEVSVLHGAVGVEHGNHETESTLFVTTTLDALNVVKVVIFTVARKKKSVLLNSIVLGHGEVHVHVVALNLDAIVREDDMTIVWHHFGYEREPFSILLNNPFGLVPSEFAVPPSIIVVLLILCQSHQGAEGEDPKHQERTERKELFHIICCV